MRLHALGAVLFAIAACDDSKPPDCKYECGNGAACPSGLTCDHAVCRQPEMLGTACTNQPDSPTVDASTSDGADSAIDAQVCSWSQLATNFSVSDLDPNPVAWDVLADETFATGGLRGKAIAQSNGPDLWLITATHFTVAAGATLTLTGAHPIAIAAETIDIAGKIVVQNGAGASGCNATPGLPVCAAGTGGGGGGYGGVGGNGGGAAGEGGAIDGVLPIPLRGGCPGAKGGDGRTGAGDLVPQLGGAGGAGGGALQLSALASITISGSIEANGYAGTAGRSDHAAGAACPGLLGRASGGGGGGGGGTILVESCVVTVEPTGKLCANGAGGGGGAGGGNTDIGVNGQNGSCDAQAGGGPGEAAMAGGGAGGFDGLPAQDGQIKDRGGGGGGGAVGRIHIHQVNGTPQTSGATIRPPANRSQ